MKSKAGGDFFIYMYFWKNAIHKLSSKKESRKDHGALADLFDRNWKMRQKMIRLVCIGHSHCNKVSLSSRQNYYMWVGNYRHLRSVRLLPTWLWWHNLGIGFATTTATVQQKRVFYLLLLYMTELLPCRPSTKKAASFQALSCRRSCIADKVILKVIWQWQIHHHDVFKPLTNIMTTWQRKKGLWTKAQLMIKYSQS